MNICFLSIVTHWHGLTGGMDLHGKHLLESLGRRGHRVTVLTTSHPSGLEYEERGGIRIHYLKHTAFGSPRKGWAKESARNLAMLLKRERFHVVVSQATAGYGICGVARRNALPLVSILHGYETMILRSVWNQVRHFRTGYAHLFNKALAAAYYTLFQEYPLLLHSSRILSVSDSVAEVFRRRPFVRKDRIKTIYPGIDLSRFSPSLSMRIEGRRRLGLSETDQVVFFLSLLSRQKGADIAIRAMDLLKHRETVKLVLAGDGDYLNEAKGLAGRLGLGSRVLFPGFVDNREAPLYYNAADVFVFPTLRLESFGIVLAEAMACEKPVIASRIGSIPDVVDHGVDGVLVPPGDSLALARQITRMLDEREYAATLAANACRKARALYGLDRMVEATEAEMEALVSHPPRGTGKALGTGLLHKP